MSELENRKQYLANAYGTIDVQPYMPGDPVEEFVPELAEAFRAGWDACKAESPSAVLTSADGEEKQEITFEQIQKDLAALEKYKSRELDNLRLLTSIIVRQAQELRDAARGLNVTPESESPKPAEGEIWNSKPLIAQLRARIKELEQDRASLRELVREAMDLLSGKTTRSNWYQRAEEATR